MPSLFYGVEFKHGYGPEMITGLAKIDGLLVGVVANAQGMLMNYPAAEHHGPSCAGHTDLQRYGKR